jgi:hypothetical protein
MEDNLWAEYDLKSLKVRKLGSAFISQGVEKLFPPKRQIFLPVNL